MPIHGAAYWGGCRRCFAVDRQNKKKGVQLLDMDLLLFPIVDNGHYSLIVVAHPGLAMMVIENENATGNTNWPG